MARRVRLGQKEVQNIESWIKEWFGSNSLPQEALSEGVGRFLYLIVHTWCVRGVELPSGARRSIKNLALLTDIKSLENKLKGRTAVTAGEVETLLVCILSNWGIEKGSGICCESMSEEEIKRTVGLLTKELMQGSATVVITKEVDEWLFGGQQPSYDYKGEVSLEEILSALAMRREVCLLVKDRAGFEGFLQVILLMIEGKERIESTGLRVAQTGFLYITARTKNTQGNRKVLIRYRV